MRNVPVDAVFAPPADAMYPPGAETWVEVSELTQGLCGPHRPGHFRGVTTIVAKLFNIVQPHFALFGERFSAASRDPADGRDLNFNIEIVSVPIVREPDGLAMSSRNAYLSAGERERALSLSLAPRVAREKHRAGARCVEEIVPCARRVLKRTPGVEVEYVAGVDAETLTAHPPLSRPRLVAVAARVGQTRLIDNTVLALQ